jgi:plastocyanin
VRILILAVATGVVLVRAGAGTGATIQAPPATGAIEGRVTYAGAPPPPTIVIEGGSTQHVLYLDKSGGLQYAVVFLPDARGGRPAPTAPAVVNQLWFIFEPQVLAVRAGQPVRFTNDDAANHNVRSFDPTNRFYMDTAPGVLNAPSHRFSPTPADRPVELSCDIHPWMVAWIYAFDHDRFAVTDASGRYRIDRVPPGRQRGAVRHAAGGLRREAMVEVEAGRTARLDTRFIADDLRLPRR